MANSSFQWETIAVHVDNLINVYFFLLLFLLITLFLIEDREKWNYFKNSTSKVAECLIGGSTYVLFVQYNNKVWFNRKNRKSLICLAVGSSYGFWTSVLEIIWRQRLTLTLTHTHIHTYIRARNEFESNHRYGFTNPMPGLYVVPTCGYEFAGSPEHTSQGSSDFGAS